MRKVCLIITKARSSFTYPTSPPLFCPNCTMLNHHWLDLFPWEMNQKIGDYSTYFSLSKVLCGSSYSHSSGKWRTMIERKSPFKFNHFDCAVLSIQSALSLEGSPFGSILKVPIATSDTNCEWRSKFLSFRANFVWVHNSPIYDECQTQ